MDNVEIKHSDSKERLSVFRVRENLSIFRVRIHINTNLKHRQALKERPFTGLVLSRVHANFEVSITGIIYKTKHKKIN